MVPFKELLEESVKVHGHLCAGQVIGVRMSILGLNLVGIDDPRGKDRKNVIVYVEIDRCATDAIMSVTGCSLGRRTMKFMDYGKMAATFLNLSTGRAVRVVAREEARESAKKYIPEDSGYVPDKMETQCTAYQVMPDEELFYWHFVKVSPRPEDLPGKPLRRVACTLCGEYVQDGREVSRDGATLCSPCARGGYYNAIECHGNSEGS